MTKKQAAAIIIRNIVRINQNANYSKMILRKNFDDFAEIREALSYFLLSQVPIPRMSYNIEELFIQKRACQRLIEHLRIYYPRNKHIQAFPPTNIQSIPNIYCQWTVGENFFKLPSIENSYWAGLIAADGCISTYNGEAAYLNLSLHKNDVKHLELFKRAVQSCRPLTFPKSDNCAVLKITSRKICKDLQTFWNITPRKSLTLLPPTRLNHQMSLAYLIGLLDGDGCISRDCSSKKNKDYCLWRLYFIAGTQELALWIKDTLGLPNRNISADGNVYRISFAGSSALKVAKILSEVEVPRLERKWKRILTEV